MSKNLITLQRTLNSLHKSSKCISVPIRRQSGWTQDGTVKSLYKNIEIPNCTLHEYVWQNLERWPQRTVSVCATTGRGYTYEQAFKLSNTFAANLRKKLKIRDGDAVAVILPNIPEFPLVAMGILKAGGVITPANPNHTAHEVSRQLLMSKAKLVVTLPETVNVIKEALKLAKLDLNIIVVKTNGNATPEGTIVFNELSEDVHIDKSCLKEVRSTINDICFLAYSSGTTGLPKGVELLHRNVIANCEQVNEPEIALHHETTATYQDVALAVLPFFHILGAAMLMFHKMSKGIKLVTLAGFQSQQFLETLVTYKTNIVFAAPSLVLMMTAQGTPKSLQYIEFLMSAGAPLTGSDAKKLIEKAQGKLDFRQGYGLSETSPAVAVGHKRLTDYGSVGKPVPSTELKIVDANLNSLGPNQTGELLVKGPQVMQGYRDNPQANSEAFTVDGWFRTGDLAFIDEEGHLTIADRLKELIKVKGFQVPPAELEGVLREHPAVNDAAVIGVPHPTSGEAPKAFVVLKPGHKAQAQEISNFVKERVAPYKRVEDVVFLDSIPKCSGGKILRRELKAEYC